MPNKTETLEKQVNQWRVEYEDDAIEQFFPKIKKLPTKLKAIAFALIGRESQGNDPYDRNDVEQAKAEKKIGQLRNSFGKLSLAERSKVFKAFSPKLSKLMEKAWTDHTARPIRRGYYQLLFRAPKEPTLSLDSRLQWLGSLLETIAEYDCNVTDAVWLAEWSGFAIESWNRDCIVPILVASIESKGKEGEQVFETLCQILRNEHPRARLGDHVLETLLAADRLEGWELVENTLIAAQRQEGLRHSIMNAAMTAHPDAFTRILKLLRDENLLRFSSVMRQLNNWFGLRWDSISVKVITPYVDEIIQFLESSAARRKALSPVATVDAEAAERTFRAIWTTAYFDISEATKAAAKLVKHQSEEVRYIALTMLDSIGSAAATKAKMPAIEDESLQVAMLAAAGGIGNHEDDFDEEPRSLPDDNKAFAKLEKLYHRLPEKATTLKPIVWPWTERKVERKMVASIMVFNLGELPPTKILPYMKGLDSWEHHHVIELLSKQKKWDKLTRETLFSLAGHASADVREAAFKALEKVSVTNEEREKLEGYLNRKATDLRDQAIDMLRKGKDPEVLDSADRLLSAGDRGRRLAGLEMLRRMCGDEQLLKECQARAKEYAEHRKKLAKEEETQLKSIALAAQQRYSFEDALGLASPENRTPPEAMKPKKVSMASKAAVDIILELEKLIHANRKEMATADSWRGKEEKPLGEFSAYDFPALNRSKPMRKQWDKFPLAQVWRDWAAKRPRKLKDKDGFELLKAWQYCEFWDEYDYDSSVKWARKPANRKKIPALFGNVDRPKLKYIDSISRIVEWLFYDEYPKGCIDFLLDATENALAQVSKDEMANLVENGAEKMERWEYDDEFDNPDWRDWGAYSKWRECLNQMLRGDFSGLSKAQFRRLWNIDRFLDQPVPGAPRKPIDRVDFWTRAIKDRLVNRDDILDALLPPPDDDGSGRFYMLSQLTSRGKEAMTAFEDCKQLRSIVTDLRDRLLEIELERGEAATVSSDAVLSVQHIGGAKTLFRIMEALGTQKLKVNTSWRKETREMRDATFTELMKTTFPADSDTQAEFTRLVKSAIQAGYCTEERLLQLSFLAPQWNKYIESYLKWEGFGEGVYWFIAHMDTWSGDAEEAAASAEGFEDDEDSDEDWNEDYDDDDDSTFEKPRKLSAWQRLVLERTPLSDEERLEGAVDVEWFHRTWKVLGTKRWSMMASAAKFAANSVQARKAQFLADVLLGNTKKSELVTGIQNKRLKDHVRLLGLLPLDKGAKQSKDIKDRYDVLQEYKKYARTLSGLTKPDAMRAVEIGSSNLARLAGYPDPLRLEWAMEAQSVADLARGPVSVTKDGVTVTLSINEESQPELSVQRGNKKLKSVPAATRRKHSDISELNDRAKELRKSAGRIKKSLEAAMCRGDLFTSAELATLCKHALIAPQIQKLVLVGEGIVGYPDKGGKALRDFDGKLEPIKKSEVLRIAHPHDLLATKKWAKWQAECFAAERIQPFKQVFRELYVATAQEKKEREGTPRFAGQQIGPRQAMALWGSRGWTTRDEVFKTFHHASIIAEVGFQWDYGTASEIEGLTLDKVVFRKSDEYKPLALAKVPPQIFSEVMRDVDLVVAVAHRGEVDPETSSSTVEMRASLIQETCKLLQIKNVKIKKTHALIDGEYAEYSLHLGSGNVQRLPGGALAILPVHAQHRGRLFLPFADDDPKSAEIISKVLLLAKDGEIQDPSILDQLAVPVGKRKVSIEPEKKTTSKSDAKSPKKSARKKASNAGVSSTGTKQYLEFDDGKSSKFWEIEIAGTDVTTRWGRKGSTGQSKTKAFGDEASAQSEFDKLLKAKKKKGYEEA